MQPIALDSANLFRLVHFFDVLAAVVFAVSGSLVASRQRLDVMAFMWFAVITGVGGGTVRDLILNVPVFWVQNPIYVSACLVTAVAMHFVAPLVESRYRMLVWFDAFGLALVTVAGTVKASDVGSPALVAVAMGAVTGMVGGILRDTLGPVPSGLPGREIYVTASVPDPASTKWRLRWARHLASRSPPLSLPRSALTPNRLGGWKGSSPLPVVRITWSFGRRR